MCYISVPRQCPAFHECSFTLSTGANQLHLTSEVINQLVYRLPCRKVTVAHVNSNDLHQLFLSVVEKVFIMIFKWYFFTVTAVPTITVALTANTTRLPSVAPYNTFSLTCTATSSVEGVGPVALPKRFLWLRRYGSSEMNLDILSSNATIQIQDGDNLTQPTSSSMLTVTEDIPQDYRYRCRVDLDLTADMILNRMDIYPITVTGKLLPCIHTYKHA